MYGVGRLCSVRKNKSNRCREKERKMGCSLPIVASLCFSPFMQMSTFEGCGRFFSSAAVEFDLVRLLLGQDFKKPAGIEESAKQSYEVAMPVSYYRFIVVKLVFFCTSV